MSRDIASRRSDVIAEDAAEYFVALRTPDAKTKAEFIGWLKLSPEHVTEFLAVAALSDSPPEVFAQPKAEELIRLAASEQNVVTLGNLNRGPSADSPEVMPSSYQGDERPKQRRAPRVGRGARRVGFAAAAAVAALSVGSLVPKLQSWLDRNIVPRSMDDH